MPDVADPGGDAGRARSRPGPGGSALARLRGAGRIDRQAGAGSGSAAASADEARRGVAHRLAGALAPPQPPALEPEPAAARPRPPADQPGPYDPLGLRWGAFLLRPTIEVDFGHDSNPGRQPGPVKGAPFIGVSPRLDVASDWSRHELHGSIDGDLVHYFGIDDANRPRLDALVGGRLDIDRDTALEAETRLHLDTERIGSDGVPTTATKRPLTEEYGATLGLTRRFGAAALTLKGAADQNDYEEVTPGDNRDYATYGLALRGTYEVTPGIRPFAEVSGDLRRYDEAPVSGPERNSRGLAGRAGIAADLTGKVAGEASLGYGGRHYDDPSLEPIDGVLADAALIWTASALTKVTLRAGTSFDETTETGASGYVSRTVGIEIEHALRRNLIASIAGKVTGTTMTASPASTTPMMRGSASSTG